MLNHYKNGRAKSTHSANRHFLSTYVKGVVQTFIYFDEEKTRTKYKQITIKGYLNFKIEKCVKRKANKLSFKCHL